MGGSILSDHELTRYHRQISLPQCDLNGQERLKQAAVLIVGVGGLGCAAAQYLAVAGIGRLTLMDGDVVELSNLQRQVLHPQAHLGMNKALSAAASLATLNPWVEVVPYPQHADAANLAMLLAEHDMVLDCSDNRSTRLLVNHFAKAAQIPLVSGAAIRFEGHTIEFDWQAPGPCYHCLALLQGDGEPPLSCVEAGVIAPLVGMIGANQALAAINGLLGIPWGTPTLRVFDGLRQHHYALQLSVHPACPECQLA